MLVTVNSVDINVKGENDINGPIFFAILSNCYISIYVLDLNLC